MRAIRPRNRGALDESVVTIDTDSAPRILFYGEDFLSEDLPVGTRVIYPRQPIAGLPNPRAAIRAALARPDVRETILEIVLEMAADFGVDDIHIIIATSLHRRMHDWEVRRMVGDK